MLISQLTYVYEDPGSLLIYPSKYPQDTVTGITFYVDHGFAAQQIIQCPYHGNDVRETYSPKQ